MITVLKGSPQYAIDANGIMTITTTWMLMPESGTDGKSAVSWLAFEAEVEAWAGKPGDKYKKPKLEDGIKEVVSYDESEAFLVADINYQCVDGRTHYEITFTNEQNLTTMQMIGNVSAEINESNEKTKTINYQLNVASDDPMAIDSSFIESGTTVTWAGVDFLVSSSSYNATSKTRYELSITAQDMSIMMIGNPQKSTDAFGQQTMSATWRYSTAAYNDWVQPLEGSDASTYLGLPEGSGYIITEVSAEPNGVLGYNISIHSKHVSKRLVKVSKQESRKSSGMGFYTTHNIQYQSDTDSVGDFDNLVGDSASSIIDGAVGYVTEVSVDEEGRNDYTVQITATDEPRSENSSEGNSDSFRNKVEISMSQSEFVLDAKQAGWFKGLSGEYYTINFPPATKYRYTMSPASIKDQRNATSNHITDAQLLDAIKKLEPVGYDRIVGVQAEVGDDIKWVNKTQLKAITSLNKIHSLKLEGFVYAQPEMTVRDETLRNLLFEPWVRRQHCPIWKNDGQWNGRDVSLNRVFLTYKIKTMDISVGKYYKGSAKSVLNKGFDYFYRQAINEVRSKAFRSYKGAGVNINEVQDEDGRTWTQVTATISALLDSNIRGIYWNENYDNSYVE